MARLATLILHISAGFPVLTIAAPQFFASPQKMAFAAEESQEGNVVLYTVVGLYLALLTVIAKLAHRRKQNQAAVVGKVKAHFSGSFGKFTLMLTTFSTIYSGYTVTGIPEEAFTRGYISLRWIGATLVIVAGMLLLYPRLRRLSVERSYTSPFDFISDRFGTRRCRLLCAACGVVPMLLYIAVQMVAFAAMVEGMTLQVIPKTPCMLIFCVIIITLEMLGGMNSVVFTDVVQCLVMLLSFLVTPFALGLEYGFLPEMAPGDCAYLSHVSPNSTSSHAAPIPCVGSDCLASGCIAAVRPDFFLFPSRSDFCDVFFFLFNMLAAPVTPHMLQRAYLAKADADLRWVIGAMLLAPFIAQPPGIVIGLVKAANNPAWPPIDQTATAFSSVMAQFKLVGVLQYVFVSVMTCCALAAIMSTADSALMGVSSVISNDILSKTLLPALSSENVVRAGTVASLCACIVSFFLGNYLTSTQMGAIKSFNGGMMMQLLPAFGMGLYTEVSERSITLGIVVGLLSLLVLVICGDSLGSYVPDISLSALLNFLTVGLSHSMQCLADESASKLLNVKAIRDMMASSREPKLALVALMLSLALVSAPWCSTPGAPEPIIFGFPRWGCIQLGAFVVVFSLGMLTVTLWKPPVAKAVPPPCDVHSVVEMPADAATKC
ncbi:Sodium/glucose cotransporter [Symbiodinium microadriaticum]|uniref:Sodium/glucose cotransporter n=1 Tax=Symbiodinium microadriaticum TaxID=2951 RepID=A0A1Q9F7N1_SYMMI|nr:Sodium/glucose cotransporter [Symbiodinium microadriaticum]